MGRVLTPPEDFHEDLLVSVLAHEWGVVAEAVEYRAVGFGSHHWEVGDGGGGRWFATLDELETRRAAMDEPLDAAYERLRAALGTACELRGHGHSFAVAPLPTHEGEPLARVKDRFGIALYPFVTSESFDYGEFATEEHRRAALDLVIAVHGVPPEERRRAMEDDFAIPHRDELELVTRAPESVRDLGPYARATAMLLGENAQAVTRLLGRYDGLVRAARARPRVLTHGEPHAGNTMRTAAGWVLIDWDTALVAPPERDLWSLDPGDGSALAAYEAATGVAPDPETLGMYRLRWDLADIASFVNRFRRPHAGTPDDDKSWDFLCSLIADLGDQGGP
ncbi:phosphotransferase family protein [Thermocatellispora tengchongensis]|uniref:phosphotransferase family protein n=1 Tax=Thermocatellispora tengchongensis TaxID=1073253 RepID=UPI0036409F40